MSAIVLDIRNGRRFDRQPVPAVPLARELKRAIDQLAFIHDEHPGAFPPMVAFLNDLAGSFGWRPSACRKQR